MGVSTARDRLIRDALHGDRGAAVQVIADASPESLGQLVEMCVGAGQPITTAGFDSLADAWTLHMETRRISSGDLHVGDITGG